MDTVILVDENDNQIGTKEKLAAHLGEGMLHRAFSVFVFNSKGEFLLQQRSKEKLLWPLYWSNACCSHPKEGETYLQAGSRRLKEEMGIDSVPKLLGMFQYVARYKDIGTEREVCPVLTAVYDGVVLPNPKEAADCKWVNFEELKKDIQLQPEKYSPWLKLELEHFYINK